MADSESLLIERMLRMIDEGWGAKVVAMIQRLPLQRRREVIARLEAERSKARHPTNRKPRG